jgi:hypothetical protein
VRLDRRWLVAVLPAVLLACSDDPPPSAPTPTPAAFVRVDIEGSPQRNLELPGATLQLRAVATFDDGTHPDVTNEAIWSVTNPSVLAVSSRGLVTAVGEGGGFVTATYRERNGTTNVTVGLAGGRRFPVTGVVVDTEQGTPVVAAEIWGAGSEPPLLARTDGNGFFTLGDLAGQVIFRARRFGYADAVVTASVRSATHLDVRLPPTPWPYIERRREGGFESVNPSGEARTTLRITTRAGGILDAIARAQPCQSNETQLWIESGDTYAFGRGGACEWARVRLVVPTSDVQLTIRGFNATGWELIFREPR